MNISLNTILLPPSDYHVTLDIPTPVYDTIFRFFVNLHEYIYDYDTFIVIALWHRLSYNFCFLD